MREVLYHFNTLGLYETKDSTSFDQPHLNIVMEPHEFSIAIGSEVLRSSSCKGYRIQVSEKGAVSFYDQENNQVANVKETDRTFRKVLLNWKQDTVSIEFGKTVWIDNYPNCDGESDRWDEKWQVEYRVTLDERTSEVKVFP